MDKTTAAWAAWAAGLVFVGGGIALVIAIRAYNEA